MAGAGAVPREAIARALVAAGDDGKINAYGPCDGPLRPGERYCTDCDNGEQITYHARSVTLSNGGWSCMSCAQSTDRGQQHELS